MKKGIYISIISVITIFCILVGLSRNTWGLNFIPNNFINGKQINGDNENLVVSGKSQEVESFSKIDVDVKVMDIKFKLGDKFEVTYDCTQGLEPEIRSEKGILKVTQKDKRKIKYGNNRATVYITVPYETVLNDAKLHSDVGDIDVNDVKFEKCEFSSNVGDINLIKISSGDVTVSGDVGDIRIEKSETRDMDLENDTGNIEVTDCIFRNIEAEGDVGDIYISTSIDLDEYEVDCSTDVGSVKVNRQNHKKSYYSKGNSKNSVKANSDIGDVTIEWK